MKNYFDTHSHLTGKFYQGNVDQDISLAKAAGVDKILVAATDEEDSKKAIELANRYPTNIYAAVGVHPSEAHTESVCDFLFQLDFKKVTAIGETGLDLYHRDTNPPLEMQKIAFLKHIALAIEHQKPLIVHARSAERETYDILRTQKLRSLIMHCYTGSKEVASDFIKLGAFISIAGMVTYTQKNEHLFQIVKLVPLKQLVVETDAPFLTPEPYRNLPNKSLFVKEVAHFVAKLRTESEEEVLKALYVNAKRAFILS